MGNGIRRGGASVSVDGVNIFVASGSGRIAFTHDKDYHKQRCVHVATKRQLCLIAQLAMKQMTRFVGGYKSKRQNI